MLLVAAPDKFRGTASAARIAAAVEVAALEHGWEIDEVPLADGGEGTLEALGGANRTTVVSSPLGDPVEAGWRLVRNTAVIEMARASGLELVGGPSANDAVAASTYGTGELITAALDAGARRIIVGVGGSATTDGGLGALRALYPLARLRGVELIVACDVTTRFVDAAEHFAEQKGASAAEVELLRRRLERLAAVYLDEHGVDVSVIDGGGAAGGLAGGLAAVGAKLVSGFDLVSDEVGLHERMAEAQLIVTGEGFVDEQSFHGKVVGGVIELAAGLDVPVLVVAGQVYDGVLDRAPGSVAAVSLQERFGAERATGDTLACVTEVVAEHLAKL